VTRTEGPKGPERRHPMSKITPFLWFDDQAEEAANFYVSLFEGSEIVSVTRRGDMGPPPKPKGGVMSLTFRLGGREYFALNGGPHYKLTEAFSMFVSCDTQEEVDRLWTALSEGGQPLRCGWLTDRFGVTWQIIPKAMTDMLADKDRARAGRVMNAMMGMVKLDIAGLKAAYEASA